MGYVLTEQLDRAGGFGFTRALLGQPHGLLSYENRPAYGVLQHTAEQIPDRIAIVDGDQKWTYRDLDRDAMAAAAMLQRLGVEPGDRVGILLPNVPEYLVAANAIWRIGACAIAISPLMVAAEVQDLLNKTDCRLVVCLDVLSQVVNVPENPHVQLLLVSIREHLPPVQQLGYLWMRRQRTGQWTIPTTDRCYWFWEEIEKTSSPWIPPAIDPLRDPAYILPTGGTTGTPKAVTLSHTNMVANAWQQFEWTGRLFGSETMLAVLPFFHSYGMSATIMSGAAMGATLILHHRFNTQHTIGMLEEHQPTVFHAVPAMLVAMNQRFRSHPPQIQGLRWVISGGAPLEESVAAEFAQHTGAWVVEGYGLSEASPVTHVGPLMVETQAGGPRYGTIGLPLPQTDCQIIDVEGNDFPMTDSSVADSQVGELIVRGPQVMLGYWKDPEATQQAIQNGWLHTGDLAVRDAEGFYRIVGRKKDLIITSGFNVYPREVEAVLCEAEGVLDAAVVGHPDPERGEVVKAFIVMKPGATWNDALLHQHCTDHLAKYKRPRIFQRCENDLPRNFLGKVIRRNLRETHHD